VPGKKMIDKCIIVMQSGEMANRSIEINNKDVKRVTVSFTQELYNYLEQIAQDKKVSLAWVVRDAVEVYKNGNENG